MKNGLNRQALVRLARNLKRAYPSFADKQFVRSCLRGLNALELKERVAHISGILSQFLPKDYLEALDILVLSRETWDGGSEDDNFRGFAAWPIFHWIESNGDAHFSHSLHALRDLTGLFTAEFAVRTFIAKDPKRAFREFKKWTRHKDDNVRRLASEGTRPRLPWATQIPGLIEDPSEGAALLESLKDDPSEYVRRSVGNHLNDIAKDHPDLVIDICKRWKKGANAERLWIIERATRTLVKNGHPGVWPLLGYSVQPKLECNPLKLSPRKLSLGSSLRIAFTITSRAKTSQKLALDYAMHFMKADGKSRPKVFKLKVLTLKSGETLNIEKSHPIKAISTRKYYPGAHQVELLVNGQSMGLAPFTLAL